MHRYELSQAQWDLIKGLVPARKSTGRPPRNPRQLFNGMLWILHTGAPWRDLPRELYGPWSTVYDHFRAWRKDGTFDRILGQLQIRLDREGRIDWDVWMVDSTMVRAGRSASGGKKGDPESPPTTLWAAREAGLGRSSTWYLTATESPSPAWRPPGKRTSRSTSGRSSTRSASRSRRAPRAAGRASSSPTRATITRRSAESSEPDTSAR